MVIIRSETIGDHSAIQTVNELAFGRRNEADLVDALREHARPFVSLVADTGERVVGHISFSPVSVEFDLGSFAGMGLAPISVLPGYQNQGIGSQLVREGLNVCQRLGHDIVFVLGHPSYYPRFGFIPASLKDLRSEYAVPDEGFMVAELKPDALGGRHGLVRYHPEFAKV